MERARGQRRAQVTQLSPWKQSEGSCGFEPPKVLLEHRLFNRREKQCYSCFLHNQVFPSSKCNRDWVIMLWSGIRWIQCFFLSPASSSPALFHVEAEAPVLKKYQSSALLLRIHLLHLQGWRSNTLFVRAWMWWLHSLPPSPSHLLHLSPSLSFCAC